MLEPEELREGREVEAKVPTPQDMRAFNELVERLYTRLRSLAARVRWHGPKATQPTSLLHDAYLKLINSHDGGWRPANEVVGIFAHVMRQIMVDAARKGRTGKRGAAQVIPLVPGDLTDIEPMHGRVAISPEDVLTLDAALMELRRENARQADIVERRYLPRYDRRRDCERSRTVDVHHRTRVAGGPEVPERQDPSEQKVGLTTCKSRTKRATRSSNLTRSI
jgi:DNA-directed RNA polymerase specialized sigma24 family protein